MNVSKMTKTIVAAGAFSAWMAASSLGLTGCMTDSEKETPPVNQHTAWGAETILTVGAQGNTSYGTAVDLDAKKVLLASAATAAQSSIDILFVFSGGDLQLAGPAAAKAAGDVPLATAYDGTKIKDIKIAKVSTIPEDSEAGKLTFEQSNPQGTAYVFDGGAYVVKTGEGKIFYVKVANVVGTDNTASAQLTIAPSGI